MEHSRPHHRSPALGPGAAVAAAVLLAFALRVWRLRQGLPDFLDEAIPFKKALEMWGADGSGLDLNPHFFNYPTLAIYLHLAVQKLYCGVGLLLGRFAGAHDFRLLVETDPTGPVVAARLLGFVADACTIWGVSRIGERLRPGAGIAAAFLIACSPTLIGTARAIHVDSVMTALSVWAVERLLAWRADGGRTRLAAAVTLIGLAAGAKYTAGGLVLPLAWVLRERDGSRGLRRWPYLAAAAGGVFLLSSPYVALDWREFWFGFTSERQHMAEGHLGVQGRTGALFYLKGILVELGPVGSLALLLSLAGLRRGAPGRGATATLWLALLPHLAGLVSFRMEAERYLAPVLPAAACLAAAAALAAAPRLGRHLPAARRPAAAPALLLAALLLPPAVGGARAALAGRDTTQQQARRWCEAHLGSGQLLLQEAFGAQLLTAFDVERVRRTAYFAGASEPARRHFLARPTYRSVVLPMTVSGRLTVRIGRPGRPPLGLTVFPRAIDFNAAFYDPRLLDGVDYFLVSGAVRRRYAVDPARYPAQNAFYARLAALAAPVARFTPDAGASGPELIIYRLGEPFWRESERRDGPLDLFWWARPVPAAYRQQVEQELIPPERRSDGAFLAPSGTTAGWVLSLRVPFDTYVAPFAMQLGQHQAELGRLAVARRHAATVLAVAPETAAAALLFSFCAVRQDDPAAARRMLETTVRNAERERQETGEVRLELVRVLLLLGDVTAARAQLAAVRASSPPGSPLARAAAARQAELDAHRSAPAPAPTSDQVTPRR